MTRERRSALIVFALLLLVFFIAATSGPKLTGISFPFGGSAGQPPPAPTQPVPVRSAQPTPTAPAEQVGNADARILLWALMFLALLALSIAIIFAVRQLLRLRARKSVFTMRTLDSEEESTEPTEPGQAEEIQEVVASGIAALEDRSADPRAAVIACWVRLERIATSSGVDRLPGETSSDLVARLLAPIPTDARVEALADVRVEAPTDAESLQRLAELYRRARYSPSEVADAMRAEALEILGHLQVVLDDSDRPVSS